MGFFDIISTDKKKSRRGRPRKNTRRRRSRTFYQVLPRKRGKGWKVLRRGASRASSTHRTKKAAFRKAKRLARKNKPAQVAVHDSRGRFQRDHTFENDPFPPRG